VIMKVTLTRPLHDASGKEIPVGETLDREDGETLIALGGAVAATQVEPASAVKDRTRKS